MSIYLTYVLRNRGPLRVTTLTRATCGCGLSYCSFVRYIERLSLAELVDGLVWYSPTQNMLRRYGDGGVAIIDQWIASHAKFFVGE